MSFTCRMPGFHGFHMVRQGIPFQLSFQGWNQAFQHQGGLARAGNTCDRRQSAFGEIHRQGLHRMDGTGGQMDPSLGKKRLGFFVRTTSASQREKVRSGSGDRPLPPPPFPGQ